MHRYKETFPLSGPIPFDHKKDPTLTTSTTKNSAQQIQLIATYIYNHFTTIMEIIIFYLYKNWSGVNWSGVNWSAYRFHG